jgi:putative endonuclease
VPVFVYILKCADDSLYVGSTTDVESRVQRHNDGAGCHYTASRRPVTVVYSEQLPTLAAALRREKQIKHWTAKKKQALIQGRLSELKKLSKSRSRRTTVRS